MEYRIITLMPRYKSPVVINGVERRFLVSLKIDAGVGNSSGPEHQFSRIFAAKNLLSSELFANFLAKLSIAGFKPENTEINVVESAAKDKAESILKPVKVKKCTSKKMKDEEIKSIEDNAIELCKKFIEKLHLELIRPEYIPPEARVIPVEQTTHHDTKEILRRNLFLDNK